MHNNPLKHVMAAEHATSTGLANARRLAGRYRSLMRSTTTTLFTLICIAISLPTLAAEKKFNGSWSIDLRSKEEQKRGIECGLATFSLVQTGNEITGNHVFSTTGCGRLNEGGDGTVKGVIIQETAVLAVTSGRNGTIVMGTATVNGDFLIWQTVHEIKPGDPQEDSPLILVKGKLTRMKSKDNHPKHDF
jgi:hypothetical protein